MTYGAIRVKFGLANGCLGVSASGYGREQRLSNERGDMGYLVAAHLVQPEPSVSISCSPALWKCRRFRSPAMTTAWTWLAPLLPANCGGSASGRAHLRSFGTKGTALSSRCALTMTVP